MISFFSPVFTKNAAGAQPQKYCSCVKRGLGMLPKKRKALMKSDDHEMESIMNANITANTGTTYLVTSAVGFVGGIRLPQTPGAGR